MNRLQRNVSASGKMIRVIKKGMACLLALNLALSPAIPALAATGDGLHTELPDEDLGDGACEGTAYTWICGEGGEGVSGAGELPRESTRRFDLCGLVGGQKQYSHAGIQTTYSWYGYETLIQVGERKYKANGKYNGNVEMPENMGVELKIALSPSPDNKYVLVDYYVYDTLGETRGKEGVHVKLGTGCDDFIGAGTGRIADGDDDAALYINTRGFHMVNGKNDGRTGVPFNTTFDCITNDESLKTTPPTHRWIGSYMSNPSPKNEWGNYIFEDSEKQEITDGHTDTAMAYSWEFQLHPYEKVHRRVAFAIRDTSYYVSKESGDDSVSAEGTYSSPFKTIEYALNKLGDKKGYIYLMDDQEISSPIQITGSAKDITIASTDFDQSGNPTTDQSDYIKTLRRSNQYKEPLFKVSDGATLKLTDIVLDGNGNASEDPLLSASSGKLEINSGANITDCHGMAASVGADESDKGLGSAVNITGSADLSMNFGKVSDNTSEGKGAVYFDSSGEFDVENDVSITDNVNASGEEANVYLGSGKTVTVTGLLDTASKIGVTTEQKPELSPGGVSTNADQEVKVAVPKADSSADISPSPFADNFFADQKNGGFYVALGTAGLPDAGSKNDENTVLKKDGYQLKCSYTDQTGNAIATEVTELHGQGDPIEITPEAVAGYTFNHVEIEPDTSGSIAWDDDGKRVTGSMPAEDVTIECKYDEVKSGFTFIANGGTPQPANVEGAVGSPVNATLPGISRYGYIFKGWSTENSPTGAIIDKFPSVFPDEMVTYYAIFQPDPNITFSCTREYANQSGSIVFQSKTEPNAGSVEGEFEASKRRIHGYTWSREDSGSMPATYDYTGTGPEPVGSFNSDGDFTGKMPGQDVTVRYRYKVDYGNDQARSTLTVVHKTQDGTIIDKTATGHFPEETITAQPLTEYGYDCVDADITKGTEADDQDDDNLVNALEGAFEGDSYSYNGVMPNQDVTIVYTYKPTEEEYPLTVKYTDSDTHDERLRDIKEPQVEMHQADDPVGMQYQEPYGYTFDSKSMFPQVPQIKWSETNNDFSGNMPNDSVTVTYSHQRDQALWKTITYRAGANGSLTDAAGMSGDVSPNESDGSYTAAALISSGTEQGYTLGDMKKKNLMPGTKADDYYRFAGWFIDSNSDGVCDHGETVLPDDFSFREDTTLTAYFEEDPAKWVDVHFAAGAHGSIDEDQNTDLHAKFDATWGEITKPRWSNEDNYQYVGWYEGDKPMTPEMRLRNGQTYTIRFTESPEPFGTNVTPPEAMAGLNSQGKGRITVYNTSLGYQYIVTDSSGTILDVIRGNELPGRLTFDGLYPGADYKAYEVTGDVHAEKGGSIDDLAAAAADKVSDPTPVLTPVLETNYQIMYDEQDEGKTNLIIKPADPDSEYAVLDSSGHVVETAPAENGGFKKPAGSPASLEFDGLDYNLEYTVVARPRGKTDITAESLIDKGSVITTDPGGELKLPTYIVETVNGQIDQVGDVTVGTDRYEEAHKGDVVKISAPENNDEGESFSHWEVTIGTAGSQGDTISSRQTSFTMEKSNVVLTAVYERRTASPSNATVVDEVRGGNRKETALDPEEIPRLEDDLTTSSDRYLIDVNHADVTYKVVYTKTAVKASDSDAVKRSAEYEGNHESAYKGAWDLHVGIERYVNGRKVNRELDDENRETFKTYIQLGKDDVDMLDYQLYEIKENTENGKTAEWVTMDADPGETGGLFTFDAHAGGHYVMVYNRAYRVYFTNTVAPIENRYRYDFKVRRGEAPADSYYSDEYGQIADQLGYFVSSDGAEYNYEGWSSSRDRFKEFDPSKPITRKTYVYAYYSNNEKEVEAARTDLEDAIDEAIRISDDYFMKEDESEDLKQAVNDALAILDQENPKAMAADLEEALEKLADKTRRYEQILDERYDQYNDKQDNGDKGGSTGGGGGGSGTRKNPYSTENPKSYVAGTNGNWVETGAADGGERQMAFVLNGGMHLSGMWALIKAPADGGGNTSERSGWYHFNDKGIMETGWIRDESGKWYYCNTEKEGNFGMMQTGWHYDGADASWYYLEAESGAMVTGWRKIGEKWYFLESVGAGVYAYDPEKGRWNYGGGTGKPLGSMYKSEMTPDGYMTDGDGAWIQ